MRFIEKVWFKPNAAHYLVAALLLPLTLLFWCVATIRRTLYAAGILSSEKAELPVIVVGNIGVGGNGKTPLVLYLVEQCRLQGIKVGILSRGYGGKAPYYPFLVDEKSSAQQVGDEPLLLFQRTKVPVVVDSNRVAGAKLLQQQGCDIIITDDGLQHYRLQRDIEFVVVDGTRQFGNGLLLPAGPLREPVSRIKSADYLVVNKTPEMNITTQTWQKNAIYMAFKASYVVNVVTGEKRLISEFVGEYPQVNALAGIGHPPRFFALLQELSFTVVNAQGFVDHHPFSVDDIAKFNHQLPLLMTEKDAVKCKPFSHENCWYVPIDAEFSASDMAPCLEKITLLAKAKNASLK